MMSPLDKLARSLLRTGLNGGNFAID